MSSRGWRKDPARHSLAGRGVSSKPSFSQSGSYKERLIRKTLDAKEVMLDEKNAVTLAWYGGHGIHAYDRFGTEIAFWNVGGFANDEADRKTVIASMKEAIIGETYFEDADVYQDWLSREAEFKEIQEGFRGKYTL